MKAAFTRFKTLAYWAMMLLAPCLSAPVLSGCDAPLTFLAGESDNEGLLVRSWNGDHAAVSVASYQTTRTQAEWESLWKMIGQPVPAALPKDKMAVAIFLGQRYERGSRVEIVSTDVERRRIDEPPRSIVVWREIKPSELIEPSTGKPADVYSPWAVRLTDVSVLPPDFRQDNQ